MGKIVAASAEINFLRDRRAFADFDFAETVGVRAIAEAGAISQSEMPGNLDPGTLMHERFAFDRGAENIEPEKAPPIRWFRRPTAKQAPADFPEQTQDALLDGPGRFLRHALLGFYRDFRFHAKSTPNQAERQPRMNSDFHGCGDGGFAITWSNESVARSISKRLAKHFRAFSRIVARASAGIASQRFNRFAVPA